MTQFESERELLKSRLARLKILIELENKKNPSTPVIIPSLSVSPQSAKKSEE